MTYQQNKPHNPMVSQPQNNHSNSNTQTSTSNNNNTNKLPTFKEAFIILCITITSLLTSVLCMILLQEGLLSVFIASIPIAMGPIVSFGVQFVFPRYQSSEVDWQQPRCLVNTVRAKHPMGMVALVLVTFSLLLLIGSSLCELTILTTMTNSSLSHVTSPPLTKPILIEEMAPGCTDNRLTWMPSLPEKIKPIYCTNWQGNSRQLKGPIYLRAFKGQNYKKNNFTVNVKVKFTSLSPIPLKPDSNIWAMILLPAPDQQGISFFALELNAKGVYRFISLNGNGNTIRQVIEEHDCHIDPISDTSLSATFTDATTQSEAIVRASVGGCVSMAHSVGVAKINNSKYIGLAAVQPSNTLSLVNFSQFRLDTNE